MTCASCWDLYTRVELYFQTFTARKELTLLEHTTHTQIKFEAISLVIINLFKIKKRTYDDDLFVDGTLWNAGPLHLAVSHVVTPHSIGVVVFGAKNR